MLLKLGSKGQEVKELQKALGLKPSGVFDEETKVAVESYQRANGLVVDGLVGEQTLGSLREKTISTDLSEKTYSPIDGLVVNKQFLPGDQYLPGPTSKDYLFLHHTLGWDNPYNTVHDWATDNRGRIGTEFVMGGRSVKGGDHRYDGELVQCMPEGAYAWHLGENGSDYMHSHSVGIELCNFGQAKDGKTYTGRTIPDDQVITLDTPFRGFTQYHAYSDTQLETLRLFILWIAERDSIDVRSGLIAEIKRSGVQAFEYNENAYNGSVKGMWTHANVRPTGKMDLFPQPSLIDMLLTI